MLLLLLTISDDEVLRKILTIYDKYHINMLRYARSLLRCLEDKNYYVDAEDIVQNAFIKIRKSIESIDMTQPEKVIGGYLMKIVKNEVTNYIKKKNNDISLGNILTVCKQCDFLEEFSKKELYIKVIKEIEMLDERYRRVIEMRLIEEKSVKEIANTLQIPESTVYTQISRGIAIIRNKLKAEVN